MNRDEIAERLQSDIRANLDSAFVLTFERRYRFNYELVVTLVNMCEVVINLDELEVRVNPANEQPILKNTCSAAIQAMRREIDTYEEAVTERNRKEQERHQERLRQLNQHQPQIAT